MKFQIGDKVIDRVGGIGRIVGRGGDHWIVHISGYVGPHYWRDDQLEFAPNGMDVAIKRHLNAKTL